MTREDALANVAMLFGDNVAYVGIDKFNHIDGEHRLPKIAAYHPDSNLMLEICEVLGGNTRWAYEGKSLVVPVDTLIWIVRGSEAIKIAKELRKYILWWMKECNDEATRDCLKMKYGYVEETLMLWRKHESNPNP